MSAVLVAVVLIGMSVTTALDRADFAARSMPVEGTVVASQSPQSGAADRVDLVVTYVVESDFAALVEVSAAVAKSLPIGSKMEVFYHPDEPWRSARSKSWPDGSNLVYLLAVLAALVAVALLVVAMRKTTAQMRG